MNQAEDCNRFSCNFCSKTNQMHNI